MAKKTLFVVTLAGTLTVLTEGKDGDEAQANALKAINEVLAKSPGILRVVGDAKVSELPAGKDKKAAANDEEEEDEDEDEEEEDEDEEEEDEEESDDEGDEDEEDEDEKPVKKKGGKLGKKPAKNDKDDKKPTGKIKLKLKD
jgi:hypothetical protein